MSRLKEPYRSRTALPPDGEALPGQKHPQLQLQLRPLFAFGAMAAVRSLQVSVKSDSGSDRSDSDSESDRDAREAEPMEVEEGELEAEDVSVNRSLKELLPVSEASSDRGLEFVVAGGTARRAGVRSVRPPLLLGRWLLSLRLFEAKNDY